MMVFKALKDIAYITMGQSPESESYNDEEVGMPFFQGNADFGEVYPNTRVWCSSPKKIAEPGDILISVRAPIGALNYAKERCCIGRGLAAISIKEEAERNYVFHLLKAKNKELNAKGTGSTFKAIGKNVLEEIQIPQISANDKQKCMGIMDSLESIIRKRRVQLSVLDKLIKARFVEMFGNIKTELLLEDVSEFITVGIANSATHAYSDSGVPLLRNQNIKENFLDDTDLKYITPEFAKLYESKKLKENDIIAMRTGYPGVCCLVPKKYEGCQTFTTLIIRLKPNNNPVYICNFINSDFAKAFIDSEKVGVAQQNLGAKSLAKMPIIIAPKEKQDIFSEFAKQVDKSKVAIQKSLAETQLLFDKLMQDYFG